MKIVGRKSFGVMSLVSLFAAVFYGQNAMSATTPTPAAEPPKAPPVESPELINALLPADSVKERRELFAKRNSPENLAKLGEEFFKILDPNAPAFDSKLRAEQTAYTSLVKEKKYAEALKAYKTYFFHRLAMDERLAKIGESSKDPLYLSDHPEAVELLKEGKILRRAGEENKLIAFGAPGVVNWGFQIPQKESDWNWGDGLSDQFYYVKFLKPLLSRYLFTRDPQYLRCWENYADDWALNNHEGMEKYGPYNLQPNAANTDSEMLQLLQSLGELQKSAPEAVESFSEATLARLLMRYVREIPLYSLQFMRNNAQNWSVGHSGTFIQAGIILSDFKESTIWVREGRRRLELYNTLTNLRDGSEIQPDIWYLNSWLDWTDPGYQTLRKELGRGYWERTHSDWFTPYWEQKFRESRELRGRFLINSIAVNNEHPVGLSCGKMGRADGLYSLIQQYEPSLFWEPATRVRLDLFAIARKPNAPVPDYTSEWYPYGGFYYLRTGWKPEDPYASFFNIPGLPDSGFRGRSNNNSFYLSAWGMDFLWSGATTSYNYCKSPICVDGQQQHKLVGRPEGNHSAFGTAWFTPPPYRWHSSPTFDFCEGVYDGPYANTKGHYPASYSVEGIVEANKNAERGVRHQRLVQVLKQQGLWVVTDWLNSEKEHDYRLDWRLPSPLPDSKSKIPFYAPSEVVLDAPGNVIRTESATNPNISMYQFSSKPLAYDGEIETSGGSFYNPKARDVDFHRVSAAWKAKGESQVVTLLYPRKDSNAPVLKPEALKLDNGQVGGFSVKREDGTRIAYLASAEATAMSAEGIKATATALLVSRSGQSIQGIVLDGKSLSLDGKAIELPAADCEFTINIPLITDNRSLITSFIPIYRPIEPVVIHPERDVFTDTEEISFTSKTPGVEIRYTVDGSEPTPTSPLYTKPLQINATTMVKARAMRPGVQKIPSTMEGTHVSVVSDALFRQEPLQKAKQVSEKDIKPGLKYEYFEGDWKNVYLTTEYEKPLKTGVVPDLLDITPRNPQDKQAYAFEYSGFLNIPQDGVYTFYAPAEMSQGSIWPGYDLQLWVGERMFNGRSSGLQQWYPGTSIHALGTWSVPLKKGMQPFRAHYADIRPGQKIAIYNFTHYTKLNYEGMDKYVWDGEKPQVEISGPGMKRQPIPAEWLRH
jgi:hypothetical protein